MSTKVNQDNKNQRGRDNALEDYFLDLIVRKKIIHREIESIVHIIRTSSLHTDYQHSIETILFGKNNLYLHHWWTLEDGLIDALHSEEIRASNFSHHGIILQILLNIIEEVFDIPDEDMHPFVLLEWREDIEHDLIIVIKNILLALRDVLQKMLEPLTNLKESRKNPLPSAYIIIEKTLLALPNMLLSEEENKIQKLKHEIQMIYQKFILSKRQKISQIDTIFTS